MTVIISARISILKGHIFLRLHARVVGLRPIQRQGKRERERERSIPYLQQAGRLLGLNEAVSFKCHVADMFMNLHSTRHVARLAMTVHIFS